MSSAEHNHPPLCCCDTQPEPTGRCPACPEHGELAPPIECPQCHQPIGRPHTEFCTLAPDRVWPEGHHLVHSEAFIDQDDPRGPACPCTYSTGPVEHSPFCPGSLDDQP